jgi:chromosome segregation ATPase
MSDAGREESTMNIAREAKEKVEQAMLERDQAVAREAQGRREIARLLEQRREQASVAMGHEEKSLEELRTRLENQLKARDDSITKLGARCAEMQAKMERSARDQRTATLERDSLMEDVDLERKRLRATIDDFAARTKESVERRDRAEAKAQSSVQDLVEKEQEMALAKAELNDRLTHLQERMDDLLKQNSSKTADIKRLENDARTLKAQLAKERIDGQMHRQQLQEEASKVSDTAAKQVADIQSRLDKANRDHADGQASTASLLASHERRSAKTIRELQDSVSNHQRMVREKNEECARANSRAVQLEQQLTVAISGQQDLEQQMLHITRELENMRELKMEATKKQKNAASRMSGLIQSEETRLRQLSEGRMENARLSREVKRLETALGRKNANSRSPTKA